MYVDTSVFGRVILDEPDKPAIQRALATFGQSLSSRLLRIELRRVGQRENALEEVDRILEDVVLLPMDEDVLTTAETMIPAVVGTLDAIHLTTAVRLARDGRIDTIMTYDKQLTTGAREHGLKVLSPK